MARILLVEDDEIMRITLFDRLKAHGWDVDQAIDGKEALVKIKQKNYHLVISDIKMPGLDGISLMGKTKEISPRTDVILMTAYGGVDNAVACLKKGAADYILKPFDMDDLTIRVNRILEMQSIRAKCAVYDASAPECKMIGSSLPMQNIHRLIASVAGSDSTVLITGESGTGKELVACAIQKQSARANGPYVRINCAAIPENLIESELFGHEKGSFTGADKKKIGKFSLADGGTILLDEIGDMPLNLQVKLLRVIEEREIETVGGLHPVPVDVRVLCSTSLDLEEEVDRGTFRKDLYFRLKVIPIELPPLRQRIEDVPELCRSFLKEFGKFRGMDLSLTPEAQEALMEYSYPGNVRELRNIMERVAVLTQSPLIQANQLPLDLRKTGGEEVEDDSYNLSEAISRLEQQVIQKALRKTGGNKTEAAKLLGISRKNLWEKLKD